MSKFEKFYLISQFCLVALAVIASTIAICSLRFIAKTVEATRTAADAAHTQAQVALDTLHSQRPNIVFGPANGDLAAYVAPTRSQQKGRILIYFRNAGPEPSRGALFNAYSNLLPNEKGQIHHLLRYRAFIKGRPAGMVSGGGVNVSAGSEYALVLNDKWVPNPKQWANIRGDRGSKRYGQFRIEGTFEYCDQWGAWRCEGFETAYDPQLGRFVPGVATPMGCEYTTEDPGYLARGADLKAEILPPCEQPEERAQKGGVNRPLRIGKPMRITLSSGNFGVPMPTEPPTPAPNQ